MTSSPDRSMAWHAARFQDQSVVDRYHLRPTYPAHTFQLLAELMGEHTGRVLDVGCGSGNLTRPLAALVEHIDAVDISQPMLQRARTLPGGGAPNIRWLLGRAEDAVLQPPYALITAGECIHWLDPDIVFPRFADLLTPQGVLAIANVEYRPEPPWQQGYQAVVKRFSSNTAYVEIDLIAAFERRGLFQKLGEALTAPECLQQPVEAFIAAQHGRSSLSLDTLGPGRAQQFEDEMRELLTPFAQENLLSMQVAGHLIWGKPRAPLRGE